MVEKIYMDYAATTPVDDRVLAAMLPYFTDIFGNPSSTHRYGQQADAGLEDARLSVAHSLHAERVDEIVFTACGTESDNLALRGAAFKRRKERKANHILVSPVEHPAVLQTVRQLQKDYGFELEFLPVDAYGLVDPEDVEAYLRPETAIVSVVYANNEIGSINPIAEIGAICRKRGVLFHTDAVQAAAHLPMNVVADKVDLLALGAHKFYGPKGVGVLYVRNGTGLVPMQTGGKQEAGMRAGTQNVAYIVGLARALQLAQQSVEERTARLVKLRDRLIEQVLVHVPRARLTGHPTQRLPNHASFVFENVDGNQLLMALDMAGFACSSGSACKVGNPQPSEILMAVGLARSWALGSLRITLGRDTTEAHIEALLKILPVAVSTARFG